jgi:hypothetical protein
MEVLSIPVGLQFVVPIITNRVLLSLLSCTFSARTLRLNSLAASEDAIAAVERSLDALRAASAVLEESTSVTPGKLLFNHFLH